MTKFTFQVTRRGKKPQEVIVQHGGKTSTLLFGPYVPESRIQRMIPSLITRRREK